MPALHQGYKAGRAQTGARTLQPHAGVDAWLATRLQALQWQRAYDADCLNPRLLSQIAKSHCPVTGAWLSPDSLSQERPRLTAAHVARLATLAPGQAYVPGRVVVMSAQALGWLEDTLQSLDGAAEGETLWRALQARAREACQDGATQASPESYERLAALVSYVTPLSHREACALPLLVLPPNRLQLSNPVQAVQALLTRLFVAGQPSRELAALRQLIQPRAVQQRLDAFVRAFRHALAAVWSARQVRFEGGAQDALLDTCLEEAWRVREVQACWHQLARQWDAAECEALLQRWSLRGAVTADSQDAALPEALDWQPHWPSARRALPRWSAVKEEPLTLGGQDLSPQQPTSDVAARPEGRSKAGAFPESLLGRSWRTPRPQPEQLRLFGAGAA